MNLSDQSNNCQKKHHLDKLVKDEIDVLDFTPPKTKHWIKSESWEVIKQRIGKTNTKLVAWGLAMAATVSLTIAAALEFNLKSLLDYTMPIKSELAYLKPQKPYQLNINQVRNMRKIDLIKVKPITKINEVSIISEDSKNSVVIHKNLDLINTNSKTRNPIINPYFSLGVGSKSIKPEVGIDFLIFSIQKNFKTKQIKLGISTELVQQTKESHSQITPFHFANLTYDNIDNRSDKGWSVKTGVLINPDSNFYQNTTLKLGLRRQFSKRLKFGPEVIFTDNLKKVYPSLTLLLLG